MGRTHRRGGSRAALLVVLLVAAPSLIPEAAAQDRVLEALREQRLRARSAEALVEVGLRAPAFRPVELPVDWETPRRLAPLLPTTTPPAVALPPMEVVPRRPAPTPEPGPDLTVIRWERVPLAEAEAFIARFGDALWTAVPPSEPTELDRMPTPEVRARLHATFGMPTRTPVARALSEAVAPSPYVQFEYWFVVNDEIPVVVTDPNGPFGQGFLMLGDEAHAAVLGTLRDDLVQRLLAQTRRMPYVDYVLARERDQWYRTGFDGERFYTTAIERPSWAPRPDRRARWFEFR